MCISIVAMCLHLYIILQSNIKCLQFHTETFKDLYNI